MAVKYIDVKASSDLFAPAVRAFGDIAIIGRSGFGTAAAKPKDIGSPAEAAKSFPNGLTSLSGDAAKDSHAIIVPVDLPVGAAVRIGVAADTEVRTVTKSEAVRTESEAVSGKHTLTLNRALDREHKAGAVVEHESDLLRAISAVFRQSPPPTRVWGVQVDFASPLWDAALDEVGTLDVQIVALANMPLNDANKDTLGRLADHVKNVGGDGKERIGVAMLDRDLPVDKMVEQNAAPVKNERMVLVAHRSPDDVAAATAGVIAGYRPHISMLLKPIDVVMTGPFADSDVTLLDDARINWITSPVLLPGHAQYLGEGYTADEGGGKKYIDVVRTLDDVNFRITAQLIRAIGNLRVSRVGLRSVVTLVESVLAPLVQQEVIEDFAVVIPLLVLYDKDPVQLNPAEEQKLKDARSMRSVPMTVSVVYAGAIHRLTIDLAFT
ncbi:hypothetical protein ACFV0O_38790 [Kitasatospora sp. NPDC059577]|uniref:hypothetical protein n=1 Tax=Kitasatospora sp. NPDC059577 TaxID=3346873 RepID=UPI0036CDA210